MFYWPKLELTDYEKKYVDYYKTKDKPGVLRRAYRVLLNSLADDSVPELNQAHWSGQVQISRRSRVFGLSFSGDTSCWRLSIERANGERFTGVNPGAPQTPSAFAGVDTSQAPIVSAMYSGSFYSPASQNTFTETGTGAPPNQPAMGLAFPLIIDPNWTFVPNEVMLFNGTPFAIETTEDPPEPVNLILEIMVHVWEFPNWECDK